MKYNPIMQTELKPCPFCGGEAILSKRYGDGFDENSGYYVECDKCYGMMDELGSADEAIEAWNRRVEVNG